ncbi:MAG: hypothetical protein AAFQ80_15595 [Cyanobacteria bacterium J06621_8]
MIGDLQEKLGIIPHESGEQSDRQMWERFSQAVIYHDHESLPEKKPPSKSESSEK